MDTDTDLRQQLVHGDPQQRLVAAMRLQQRGVEGAQILAGLACDMALDERTRLVALWHLVPALLPDPHEAMLTLLGDPASAVRYWALKKVGEAMLVELSTAVAKLTSDNSCFHGLEEALIVSDAAHETLALLGAR